MAIQECRRWDAIHWDPWCICLICSWSCGYKGTQLQFIDNTTLAYGCGNTLTFVNYNGQHVRSLPSEGRGVGPIAVSPRSGLIAYAEMTLQPQIFVLKYPDCSLEARLRGESDCMYPRLQGESDCMYP